MAAADRAAVLEWMAVESKGYKAAAKHFDLPVDTVKSWGREARGVGSRARARATREAGVPLRPPAVPPPPPVTVAPHRPPFDGLVSDVAALSREAYYAWKLSEIEADLVQVRARGRTEQVAKLLSEQRAHRQALDEARGDAGRVVAIERTPDAVAAAVLDRRDLLERLAAARVARAAKARSL